MARDKSSSSAPEKHGYEFGGPIGALGISLGSPFVAYVLAFACNDVSGCPAPSLLHPSSLTLDKLKADVGWHGPSTLLNGQAFLATLGYYLLSLATYALLPATEVEGVELRSGGRLKYRLNAFSSALFICSLLAAGTLAQGADFPVWPFIWDNFIPLLTSNLIIANLLATFVYVRSFSVPATPNPARRELAAGGHSGNMVYDWFIGRELNPRVSLPVFGEVDIKAFMELRPGMLGWVVLDLAFVARQYRAHGVVTDSILLVVFSQAVYVFDALYMEPAILTTVDVIGDGFGFMLAFGDLVWVPFVYCVQARYLAMHPVALGPWGVAAVLAVQGSGYALFRAANNEKNRFRTDPADPKVSHLAYMETAAGSKLLTGGWWGTARHVNYLGDWLMSWAYALPTGLAGFVVRYGTPAPGGAPVRLGLDPGDARGWGMLVTYFYLAYFAVLLVHRERRDEEKCRRKYGADWDEYCRRVRWRIVPGVY